MLGINELLSILAVCGILTWIVWIMIYGFRRGTLATLLRCLWIAPLVFLFFPKIKSIEIPSVLSVQPIHVLLDDSKSMKTFGWDNQAQQRINGLMDECKRLGCSLEVSRLSELSDKVAQNQTPLGEVLPLWNYDIGSDPWILFSDGGVSLPTEPWNENLKGMGVQENGLKDLLVALFRRGRKYLGDHISRQIFSFEGKNTYISSLVNRVKTESNLPVQIQVSVGNQHLTSTNVTFRPGDSQVALDLPLAPMTRGTHFLTIEALPIASEQILWDNKINRNIEVMPNTIGVLHLLGSPSWDGRFVRRYLKSEPKYDLISFFILRDPIDLQLTNERELSLIPFPVDRLFNEELPNFRNLILQNFFPLSVS